MRDVLIIAPTRERLFNAERLISTVTATAVMKTDLVLAIDDDDETYDGLAGFSGVVRGSRRSCAEWLTDIALERAAGYRAIASFGDDHVPVTPGWDRLLLEALGNRMGVAYGNDLLQCEKVPTAAVISSPVISILGYMTPPGVEHLYIDCFWKLLGEELGCLQYLPEVIIEHMHYVAGKAPEDDGYKRVNSPGQYAHDKDAYDRFLAQRWPGDLVRLREKLGAMHEA
jgi:hypothetical protein